MHPFLASLLGVHDLQGVGALGSLRHRFSDCTGVASLLSPAAVLSWLPEFTTAQWLLIALAAVGIGISKSGLPGISLLHVLIFAHLFPGIASTGVVLPMLIVGDIGAVILFRRHALWSYVTKTLPPAVVGVIMGWGILHYLPNTRFQLLIGVVILMLAVIQLTRSWKPGLFTQLPHTQTFAWTMGFIAGVTTMVANAAGPVMGVYLLAVDLPKAEFVGTSAWFFLLINLIKIPFSLQLGLIHGKTLLFNAILIPFIVSGLFLGRYIVSRISQRWFDTLILGFALIVAAKLLVSGIAAAH